MLVHYLQALLCGLMARKSPLALVVMRLAGEFACVVTL